MGVTLQGADVGDTTSIAATLEETVETLLDVREHGVQVQLPQESVTDKGYHSNDTCVLTGKMGMRSYMSEPDRGRRNWDGKAAEREAVYGNRRRIRGKRGKELLRKRGEMVERTFAHCYETGGMRRTHLRGHENILKRLLVHIAGFNLSVVLRAVHGLGKPRTLQDGMARRLATVLADLVAWRESMKALHAPLVALWARIRQKPPAQTSLAAA